MRHLPSTRNAAAVFSFTSFLLVACGGAGGTGLEPTGVDSGIAHDASSPAAPDAGSGDGSAPSAGDSAAGPGVDSGPIGPDPGDGTPTRKTCTGNFGSALSSVHGRLDGYLVAIVQPHTNQTCNSDSHVHLQVSVNGATYDVATNLQTLYLAQDIALPDGAWAEGWHTAAPLDYRGMGLSAAAFIQPANEAALAAIVTADLANANHISIFATGYGPGGVHDVHRRGTSEDGAIIIDPLSATSHGLFFRFSTDSW